jgi:hypothetical protein
MIWDAFLDAGSDTLKLLPFLFLTYVLMEWLERKTSEKQTAMLVKVGRWGPLFGGAAGIVPQCGFSAAASSLYAGGVLSVGTLMAVFLSTSDEMLPMLISTGTDTKTILRIVLTKVIIGMVTGFLIDFVIRLIHFHEKDKKIHDLCEAEQCGCEEEEGSIFKAALIHTVHIALFVLAISFVLTLAVEGFGEDAIRSLLTSRKITGVFLTALVGLIPNCGASVAITQLYLDGMITGGQMMSGLLVSAGVGLLVLFRTNRHVKENIRITILLYACGVIWGLLLEGAGIVF